MAKLILKFNDAVIEQIEIKPGDMAIGRRPGSDVLIDNLAVSGNHANIFSGANSGKRIELTAPVTNLGKTGKPAGTISRKQNSYILSAAKGGEVPKLNGKLVPAQGEELKNGDIIEVGDSRLQFYFK